MEEEKKPLVEDLSEGKALNEEEVPQKPKNVFKYKNYTLTFLGALVSNLGSILYSFEVSFYILAFSVLLSVPVSSLLTHCFLSSS